MHVPSSDITDSVSTQELGEQSRAEIKERIEVLEALIHQKRQPGSQITDEDIESLLKEGITGIAQENIEKVILNCFYQDGAESNEESDEITLFHRLCGANLSCSIIENCIPAIKEIDLPTRRGGWTPLMEAIIGCQPNEVIQLLIDNKADVNKTNEKNYLSPLHLCLLLKYQQVIDKELVEDSQRIYSLLIENKAQIISRTFLIALNNETTMGLINKFKISRQSQDELCAEVNREAARELSEAIDSYQHTGDSLIFDLLSELIEAGEQKEDVVNTPVRDRTPFEKACLVLKGLVATQSERGKTDAEELERFFNKIVKKIVDCGAKVEEDSKVYKMLYAEESSTSSLFSEYRKKLIEHVNKTQQQKQQLRQSGAGVFF